MPLRIHDSEHFSIDSDFNGLGYNIVRKACGKSVYLQGDDAVILRGEFLQARSAGAVDQICDQYSGVMT